MCMAHCSRCYCSNGDSKTEGCPLISYPRPHGDCSCSLATGPTRFEKRTRRPTHALSNSVAMSSMLPSAARGVKGSWHRFRECSMLSLFPSQQIESLPLHVHTIKQEHR